MIPALPSRLVVIAIAAVITVALPRIAAAGRCTTSLVSGGGPDTCTTDWGATLFGYSRGTVGKASPPGFYHWKSGSFDLEVTDGKPSCGTLGQCLGSGYQSPWTIRIVGTPRPGSKVPCLGADACSPLPDGDPGCL